MRPVNWTARAIAALRPGASWALEGDTYAGLTWHDDSQTMPTQAEVEAEAARLQVRADVPASVSPLQMRRALRQLGLHDEVTAFVEAQPPEVREAWEYAVQIDRDNALIAAASAALGKTEAETDDLFRLAAAL